MSDEIINRVAQSQLMTIDLEQLYPKGQSAVLDIAQWLDDGIVLREKEFRAQLKAQDWTAYDGQWVALYCSTDAILPAWAPLLVSSYLQPFARKVFWGSLEEMEVQFFCDEIRLFDCSPYIDKAVIIKGCSEKSVPRQAYIELILKLQYVAKSMFYGEACSSVPLYKKK